jgi:hypothetical protein
VREKKRKRVYTWMCMRGRGRERDQSRYKCILQYIDSCISAIDVSHALCCLGDDA